MKTNRLVRGMVMAAAYMGLTALSAFAQQPSSVRLEPEPSKEADEAVESRISWADLMKKGFRYDSSIANMGYIPQALVLEGTSKPQSIKIQIRTIGQWYWGNEGPTFNLSGLPVQTSEWIDVKVAPEGWALLPVRDLLAEAAGYGEPPKPDAVAAALKKAYPPVDGEEDIEKRFRDQLKEYGEDSIMSQIVYDLGSIEIRFAEKDKDFPKKAQMVITIVPGC